jgi:glycine oxidase
LSRTLVDVAIVGGGIAGLTIAVECAARGLTVGLCDSSQPGAASPASAGVLGPSIGGRPSDDPIQRFFIAARDAYPAFLDRLRETTGITVPTVSGILQFPESNAALEAAERAAPPDAMLVDSRGVFAIEPSLRAGWVGLFHQRDGAVDVETLLEALSVSIAKQAPKIERCAGAKRVRLDRHENSIELADGRKVVANRIVVASGAWAGTLPGLPRALPVVPLKGEIVLAQPAVLRHVVFAAGGYLVPRGDYLIVGATSLSTGFDATFTTGSAAGLAAIADAVLPSHAPWLPRVDRQAAGLRPVTPDLLPILGADPENPAIIYASGYSRNGILIAPLAARCIASVACGESPAHDLTPFSVARFATVPTSAG